jgi:deoxyribodipyrimidine photolyase-related protein
MTTALVILPIHLFESSIITSLKQTPDHIYIIEEPAYFGDHKQKMNFNKLKLIYHRATLQYYYNYLSSTTKNPITYIEYSNLKKSSGYNPIKSSSKVIMFNPVDTYLDTKYKKLFGKKLEYLETPLFLCTSTDLANYHKSKTNKDSYFHASFYTWQRDRLDILAGSKTYDTENRNMMPLDTTVPALPKNDSKTVAKKYITEAITYVQLHWSNNLQPIDQSITIDSIHFPITHKTATEWLKHFCKSRFDLFGKYEDSIDSKPRNFLFHSAISPMLNLGLITPKQVIDIVTKYYTAHKTAIGIANYEAFIRQVIGWREYQRYIYQYAGDKMRGSNHFDNNKRLNQHWYNATLGVKPVDDAVKMAINDGYIHHILRLMVVGNFMNLVGIHPDDVYKWFMEFSLDSYDWVMVGNVYSMALWADGGLTMRKPYISGDGYIMKMSNYKKEASTGTTVDKMGWNDKWNVVFHHFIDRNAEKLEKTYYNGLVKAWKRKSEKEKNAEMDKANEIIKSIVI